MKHANLTNGLKLVDSSATEERARWRNIVLGGVILLGAFTGCAFDETDSETSSVLRGNSADSPRLNAVGALGYSKDNGELDTFCSGTLITERALLTAEHCTPTIDLLHSLEREALFIIGPDIADPEEVIVIGSHEAAPDGDHPGLLGFGRDVAVVHLEESVESARPLKVRRVRKRHLGRKFLTVGYGFHNQDGDSGVRYKGVLRLKSVGGRWYEELFGDFDSFFEFFRTDAVLGEEEDPNDIELARTYWDAFNLEPQYEGLAVADHGVDGAATAGGDSGAPLLRRHRGRYYVYGVLSGGEQSQAHGTAYGSAYGLMIGSTYGFVRDIVDCSWPTPSQATTARDTPRQHPLSATATHHGSPGVGDEWAR